MGDDAQAGLFAKKATRPLADRLRPQSFTEILGQEHIIGDGGPLGRMLQSKALTSIVFWGPPGTGKTSIAQLLVAEVDLEFLQISAVFSGVADLRAVFDQAQENLQQGRGTCLFVDEIHRFNRAQQDSFLHYVERGVVVLIGATTENPSFELNAALLSRLQVMVLRSLGDEAMEILLQRAEAEMGRDLPLVKDARAHLCAMADGDGRYLLNIVESLYLMGQRKPLDREELAKFCQRRAPIYDKSRDSHYNLISALHKSMRGSDCDAALYWLARMLTGGEDPNYIARRVLRFAYEDIGMADPQAAVQALNAWQTYERLGSPEGEIAIVHAVIYLACAPKSNAVYIAQKQSSASAKVYGSSPPPKHILNAPTKLMKDEGYGKGYRYDHNEEHDFSAQNYFPETLQRQQFYQPLERGFERKILERLAYWQKLRKKHEENRVTT
ncbi:MAG: replication-associated recombination protein A [Pseudomonadota bacterium]